MTGGPALILDVSRGQDRLTVGLGETGATVQSYEPVPADWDEIATVSRSILTLLDKAGEMGGLAVGTAVDLRKEGRWLFEKLLSPDIQLRIRSAAAVDLTLQLDEQLVFIPWELLFDGEDFLCLRFNLGRCVKTRQRLQHPNAKLPAAPWRMLVIADPKDDLPAAAREARCLRQEVAAFPSMILTSKTKNVLRRYLSRNIHECDILHYAGHAEYDWTDPCNSGWLFADGKFTVRELMELGAVTPLPPVIFMNACRSALPVPHGQDGQTERHLFGLANILLAAGARYIIGALGRVPDEPALQMACHFYRHLAEGQPVGTAFRNARGDLRARFGEENLSWAGYVLYGAPAGCIGEAVKPFPRGFPSRPAWPGMAGLGLGLALFLGTVWYGAGHGLRQVRVQTEIRAAREALAAGRQEIAEQHYEQALTVRPGEPQAALELARIYSRLHEHAKAAGVLERAFAGVGRSGRPSLRWPLGYALASEFYALGKYGRTVELLKELLSGQPPDPDPAALASYYELLGHASAMAYDYQAADNWYEKGRRIGREHALYPALLRMTLARADNAWEAYLRSRLSSGKDPQPNGGALPAVLRLYEDAGEQAVRQQDILAEARVAEGMAKVYRSRDDWEQARSQYNKAVALWSALPVLTREEKLRMLNACLDLARGYVHPGLEFSEAWHALDRFQKIMESLKGIPADQGEGVHVLQRKFELFMSELSGRGYRNSDLYRRSAIIYDRFMSIPYLETDVPGDHR